jgi:branched-chain amino acid transport system substrate-binding protein
MWGDYSMTAIKCSLVVLIACIASILGYSPSLAADEILVGATVSLEGRFKEPSKMMQLSYRLWEKQVNEAGGILGRPVRLIFYNDQSKRELVSVYYEKMILEDKVDLVFAPYGTTLTFEASSVTERHGIVLLACAASGEMIWNRGYRYVFGVYGIAKRYFIGFLDIAARNGLQSVAIISEDALFTKDAAAGAARWARRMGLKVDLEQVYDNGSEAFTSLIARLETLKPDAVILCSYPPDGYLFIEKLSASTFKPKALAMSITPGLPDFWDKAGAMAEGVFGPSQWEPDKRVPFPGSRRFIQEFTQYAGVSPSYHAGAAYAGCQLLQESIKVQGEINHTKIRDYIAALDTVTVIGRFKVDTRGRQVGHNTIIIQWQNGKKEIVYPRKMLTSQPSFGATGRLRK